MALEFPYRHHITCHFSAVGKSLRNIVCHLNVHPNTPKIFLAEFQAV